MAEEEWKEDTGVRAVISAFNSCLVGIVTKCLVTFFFQGKKVQAVIAFMFEAALLKPMHGKTYLLTCCIL
jgi:hypothetical protein